jgi:predicted Rossmann fold nucleotide-binding protein DprA/Smf involved in DNA uptake
MTIPILSPDTQAILLLYGRFSKDSLSKPLTLTEYNKLAAWLRTHQYRPGDLLIDETIMVALESDTQSQIDAQRLRNLLNRGAALAFAIERWSSQGLWILSRSDATYPQILKTRLQQSAPPLLYGAGSQDALAWGGLAMVGSRDADEKALDFTRETARACAKSGIPVISGSAKGVDSEAMESSLAAGGTVVGILADSLSKAVVGKKHRESLRSGQLTLMTPYDPAASFTPSNAMGRNKFIYVLSTAALVISSSANRGGTWEGAIENLRHGWVPMYVRDTNSPEGNRLLIEAGGLSHALPQPPTSLLIKFDELEVPLNEPESLLEAEEQPKVIEQEEPIRSEAVPQPAECLLEGESGSRYPASGKTLRTIPSLQSQTAFDILWPYMEGCLREEITAKDLAHYFSVQLKQMEVWLDLAITLGRVEKLSKPARYISKQQLDLFRKHSA